MWGSGNDNDNVFIKQLLLSKVIHSTGGNCVSQQFSIDSLLLSIDLTIKLYRPSKNRIK